MKEEKIKTTSIMTETKCVGMCNFCHKIIRANSPKEFADKVAEHYRSESKKYSCKRKKVKP